VSKVLQKSASPSRLSTARALRRLRARRREAQGLDAQPGSAALRLDPRGAVLGLAAGAAELLGGEPADLVGRFLLPRIQVGDRPEFLCALDSAVHGTGTARATFRLCRVGGATPDAQNGGACVWLEARMTREGEGDDARLAVALRDVSEVREAELRLEAVQREAAAALSLKDRLLANVTHELRTPLNAILGFSELLSNPAIGPTSADKCMEYARIIHSSADHLLSVVNLLLDMSRLEAGQFELTPEPFALAPLIANCRDMLLLKAQARQLELDAPLPGPHIEINADKRACRQILLNLMSNAVKFSKPGGRVTVEGRENGADIEIAVLDEGIGIDPRHLPRIGDPFFQARAGYDRIAEGSGLGLSLVRGLVGLHGGGLTIESALGVGTRVTVRLPVDGREAPPDALAATRFEIIPRLKLTASESESRRRIQERRIA